MKLWTKYKLKKRGITAQKPRKKEVEGRVRKALEKSHVVKGLIGISCCAGVIGILLLVPETSRESLDIYVGQPAPEDVFADLGFFYENKEKTEKLRREAAEKVLPRYSFNSAKLNNSVREIRDFLSPADAGEERVEEVKQPPQEKLEREGMPVVTELEPLDLEVLRNVKDPAALAIEMENLLVSLGSTDVPTRVEVERAARSGGADETGEIYRVAVLGIGQARIDQWALRAFPRDRKVRDAITRVLHSLCERSVEYDEDLTRKIKAGVEARIQPVKSEVKPGRKIIDKGYEVSPQQMDIYMAYLLKKEEISPPPVKMRQHMYYVLGLALLIVMFFIVSRRYLRRYQKKIYGSNSSLLMLELIILGSLLLSQAITLIPFGTIQSAWSNIFSYLVVISVPMAAILMVLLLNRTLALFFVVLIGIFVGVMKGFNLAFMIVSSMGGIVAIYSTIGLRRRTQLVRAGATIALANIITIGAIDAVFNLNIVSPVVGYRVAGGFAAGMLSAFIAASFLPLFEYVFNVVTDISFLELSDLNHPLLKRMFVEAPGTYHHSLMVGNLAEAAAEAVGANPLQVRVCAYFHDIGKLKKPEYFGENEIYGKSKHDEINARMSGLIIRSHVKDGIDMAVKNKLNRAILDGIREHHGTGLMYFFYRREKDAKEREGEVSPEDFRYPGPKPQSKEAAILLLADAVEAASRSLDRPTPSRVRNLVREIINQRIIDGQLDECDLTFRDLHRIAEQFEHILNGTFHTRVKYPERESEVERNAGFSKEPDKEEQG